MINLCANIPNYVKLIRNINSARGQPNAMRLTISSNMAVYIFTRMMSSTWCVVAYYIILYYYQLHPRAWHHRIFNTKEVWIHQEF